jgi:hypothetical protein
VPQGEHTGDIIRIEDHSKIFFGRELFADPALQRLLPEYSDAVRSSLAQHYIRVYSALWSSPQPHILTSAELIISKQLGGIFNYTAVHKRNMEGDQMEYWYHRWW